MSFNNDNFMDFILRKHFDLSEIEQDLSDRWREDEFNCYIAEQALDIACDLYPDDQPGEDDDTLMDKRHVWVADFLEFVRSEVIRKWAINLGMKPSNAITSETHNLILDTVIKNYKKKCCCCCKNRVPQDSEDEAWEQLKAFQKDNFNDNV